MPLLGFSQEEIDAMYDDIVEFSELSEFMDQKLKNSIPVVCRCVGNLRSPLRLRATYWSWMKYWLWAMKRSNVKCDNFFTEVKQDPTKTVILVTHSMDSVKILQ